MITQLAHICFTTTDLEATVHFYHTVLGLDVRFNFLRGEEKIGCYFDLGNKTFLECFTRNAGEHEQGDIRHFCLEVDDLDVLCTRLEENGVTPRGRRTGSDGSLQLWCTDPNGIDIEFQTYTPESCQFSGRDCHVDW